MMKGILLCLPLLCGLAVAADEGPATNVMIITADGSFEYEGDTAIYRKNVRAVDAQMRLTCEQLTIYFSTNRSSSPPGVASFPTNTQRIERIVAETNVVIVQQESRATGQKAVYTATNELIFLMGDPLVETAQGFLSCSNLYYDRLRNKLWGVGGIVMSNRPGMNLFGTNSLGISLPGTKRPQRTD